MPKVSVIMPVYNGAKYIGEAIQSVLAQTFTDWELIVVDDGSTDSTKKCIETHSDGRVHYYYQENQGASAARNLGLERSRGRYILCLDADDWLHNRCLETLVGVADPLNNELCVVHGDWAYADSQGRVGVRRSSAFVRGPGLNTLVLLNPLLTCIVLSSRKALSLVGGYSRERHTLEDWELWLEMAASGIQFVHVPKRVAYYRWHPASKSKNADARRADRLGTLDRFWSRTDIPAAITRMKAASYSTAHLDFCVSCLNQGQTNSALAEFDAATRYDQSVAAAVDTYYRMVFANQSASASADNNWLEDLDEVRAQRNIDLVLDHLGSRSVRSSELDIRRARFAAFYALGLACYHKMQLASSRKWLFRALRFAATPGQRISTIYLFLKSSSPSQILRLRRRFTANA